MSTFAELGLIEPLQRALRDNQYVDPTPIQAQSLPLLLAGRDLLGCARTGTGKTAAFALPILQRLASVDSRTPGRSPRALILVPTRELAAQVAQSFVTYGRHLPLAVGLVYGGVGQGEQVRALRRGIDILVATPGRLLDLMGQRYARLDSVEVLVLDEADHMLDLGFIPAIRRIVSAVPQRRQTLLFSATMPPPIGALADRLLVHPEKVFVTPAATTAEAVVQRIYFVERDAKTELLAHLLLDPKVSRALVFTRTKHGADKVTKRLISSGIPAQAIHGNKSQGQRERAMHGFRTGHVRVMVATDIAARGIDIDDISHVFNYELPNVPETYVHRIGRTARAGSSGVAISFCDGEERALLRDIEKLIKQTVPRASASPNELPPRAHQPAPRGHHVHGPQAALSHAPQEEAQPVHHGPRPHPGQRSRNQPQQGASPFARRERRGGWRPHR